MKKIAIFIFAAVIFSFTLQTEKEYKFSFNQSQVNMLYSTLEGAKNVTRISNIPFSEGVEFMKQIDSIEHLIVNQYTPQVDTAKKK